MNIPRCIRAKLTASENGTDVRIEEIQKIVEFIEGCPWEREVVRTLTEEEIKALNMSFVDTAIERDRNNMRTEIIRCDTCTKEHNAQYVLSNEWVEIRKSDGFGNDESMHFCSKTCLIKWASIGIAAYDVEIMIDAIQKNG